MKLADALIPEKKAFLTPEEQIEKLLEKGITFAKGYSKEDAKNYLIRNNNYYKLTSYRKNFKKDSNGQYIDLDFEDLVNLAIVDMLFRYHIIRMTLDIEHFEKVRLLNFLKLKNDDGYFIVESFRASLETISADKVNDLDREIKRNSNSVYCGDIINHIQPGQKMPVWAFVEVIPFGRFREFFEYCAKKYNDVTLIDEAYRLRNVKSIRNAAGHSNCILNDLRLSNNTELNNTYDLNRKVLNKFKQLYNDTYKDFKNSEPEFIQNRRIKEIITLFYTHSRILPSDSMKRHYKDELTAFAEQIDFYIHDLRQSNELIDNACSIVKKLTENWY